MTEKQAAEPMLQFFKYDHLPADKQAVSKPFGDLAASMTENLPRNPERSAMLRKLLEAKDCAVRALIYVAMLLLLVPLSANAQDAAPAPAPAPSALANFFAQYVLPVLMTVGGGLLTALGAKGFVWLTAKAKSTVFEGIVARAGETMRSVVAHVDAELKPKLLSAMSPDSDGGISITAKEAAELKKSALDIFMATVAPDVLKGLQAEFGSGLTSWLSGLLERAVDTHQAAKLASNGDAPAAAASATVPPVP